MGKDSGVLWRYEYVCGEMDEVVDAAVFLGGGWIWMVLSVDVTVLWRTRWRETVIRKRAVIGQVNTGEDDAVDGDDGSGDARGPLLIVCVCTYVPGGGGGDDSSGKR